MADIHWIKLSTDLLVNRKILYLRHMPERDSLFYLWVALLTLAGRCNAAGRIFFTENIPYTPKMLANELDVEESALLFALDTFEAIEMISRAEDGSIYILGWEEHQSTDAMEQIREQNRLRKRKQRERQNSVSASRDREAALRDSHAIDIEEDIDTEKEKKKSMKKKCPLKKRMWTSLELGTVLFSKNRMSLPLKAGKRNDPVFRGSSLFPTLWRTSSPRLTG